jgi:hypothetical protein
MRKKIKTRNKFCFASEFVFAREIAGFPLRDAARICCRDIRTIRDWESGKQPCPAWALRLITLESRYMDALYGIQRDRSTGFALGLTRTTINANDDTYSTQLPLKLVLV